MIPHTLKRLALANPRLVVTLGMLTMIVFVTIAHGGAVGTAEAGNFSGGSGGLIDTGP